MDLIDRLKFMLSDKPMPPAKNPRMQFPVTEFGGYDRQPSQSEMDLEEMLRQWRLKMMQQRMMMQRNQNGFPMQMPPQMPQQGISGVNGQPQRRPMFNIPYPMSGGIRG